MLSSIKHRNNKQKYYLLNYLSLLIPDFFYRNNLRKKLNSLSDFDFDYIKNRVNYYNKLNKEIKLNKDDESLNNFKIKNFHRTYFFDTYQYLLHTSWQMALIVLQFQYKTQKLYDQLA